MFLVFKFSVEYSFLCVCVFFQIYECGIREYAVLSGGHSIGIEMFVLMLKLPNIAVSNGISVLCLLVGI